MSTMKALYRALLRAGLLAAIAGPVWAGPALTMHKDPSCGCCTAWADHLEAAGFEVESIDSRDMRRVKIEHGLTPELASCHTATVEGYVIEGHVPAADIQRLLEERPDVAGLAVPGMPHGSPGMETGRVDDYAVLSWQRDGGAPTIFSEYRH